MANLSICSFIGCRNIGKLTKGLCSMHYQRLRKNGDPAISKYARVAKGTLCKHGSCAKAAHAKGYCQNHYVQDRLAESRSAVGRVHAKINPIAPTDAAYMAGMIDADGMVTLIRSPSKRLASPMVCVMNSNFGLIEWIVSVVGAGCAYETKTVPKRPDQNRENWNKVHRYQITGRKAQSLLMACRPYMKVKARQADLVIGIPMRGRDFPGLAQDAHVTLAASILAEVRMLNARGRKPDHHIGSA